MNMVWRLGPDVARSGTGLRASGARPYTIPLVTHILAGLETVTPPVRDGVDRVPASYVWPATLRFPACERKLIYLDLNHWISLAKAVSGHDDGVVHRPILDRCVRAVKDGRAIFPISDTTYLEILKIKQHRQRRDLREAIELVSRFVVVAARPTVSVHEIETILDSVAGPNPQPLGTLNYLGWGVARAFGRVGGFRVKNQRGEDVTEEVRASHPLGPERFDSVLAAAELELNRQVLDGPTPQEEPELRKLGWDPTLILKVAERRAERELEQVHRFDQDPQWRRGRIRDVVTAREILIEINSPLSRGLQQRGLTLEAVFSDSQVARRICDSMPSFDVAVTLKTSYHRDPNHRWTPNDIHDIDVLGSTLPYCDVVVTDKEVSSHAERTGLTDDLNVIVLSQLSELLDHL